MASPLQQAGALSDPSYSAPLQMNRIFTGIWTNRSPLRDAATPYIQEKYYSASRQDSIWDGRNAEISSKLTLVRRPGSTVYNSQTFPPIDRFYEFRKFGPSGEQITVIADTANTVYDATGPDTKLALWTKSEGAGKTTFQSVGNTLYFGNGIDQKKYTQSLLRWTPNTAYKAGQFIVDPAGNLQQVQPQITADVFVISVTANVVRILYSYINPKPIAPYPIGSTVTITGATTIPAINGVSLEVSDTDFEGIYAPFIHANVSLSAETGKISSAIPETSGTSQPNWGTVQGQNVPDGETIIWVCKGPAVTDWMFAAPTTAPTLTQAPLPALYPDWTASTLYSTSLALVDSNDNIQLLTTPGTTGLVEPTWSTALNATTADGTAIWTNKGTKAWIANTAYALGAIVSATFTYSIQVQDSTGAYVSTSVTVTDAFVCTVAGMSGATPPNWQAGTGTLVPDNSITWKCTGKTMAWADLGASQPVVLEQKIVDVNGNLQTITTSGKSDATAPTWATSKGTVTTEATGAAWTNGGPYSAAGTAPATYAYSFGNSLTGDESSRSPLSEPITLGAKSVVIVQGQGSLDQQVDTIYIYRTLQGGSTLLRLAAIPAPINIAGQTWTYVDSLPDSSLNALIQASTTNNPPPVGLTALTYHLGRIWGAVSNVVYYSSAIGANVGVSVSSFPPLNSFTCPSKVTRLWPTSIGLIVFTVSDTYLISGDAFTSALVNQSFITGLGLLSYDAFASNGTTIYVMTTSSQIISLDPSAGITESGFPIADVLQTKYDPATAYLTFHSQTSNDTALYAADGATGWFRMAATTAPESGFAWSPFAYVTGGVQAVKSIEVTPGTKRLLLGPVNIPGPILQRDLTVHSDNGVPYECDVTFGSIVLAQPGQLAGLQFITLDSTRVGTCPTMGLLLGEISGTFETLTRTRQDPPNLPPSQTLFNDRYNMGQNPASVWCRHFQMKLSWPAEDAASELLAFTIFGELRSEFKAG